MVSICTEILNNYFASLSDDFHIEGHGDGCVIVTPFIRPDGDCIEILVESTAEGKLSLTDMGDTLGYLHVSGLALSRRLLDDARRIGHRFGAEIKINEIMVESDLDRIGHSLHDLAQASLNIAALVEKRRPYTNLRFDEEVEAIIIANGKRYDPQYEVRGEREPHTLRFHINSGLSMLVQPFTQSSVNSARIQSERWNYRFNDILSVNSGWNIFALLDDRGERASIWANPHVTRPLEGLVRIVRWSERNKFVSALSGEDDA